MKIHASRQHACRFLGLVLALMLTGGCLGPNPLFSVGTTAVNATIMRLVNILIDSLLVGV